MNLTDKINREIAKQELNAILEGALEVGARGAAIETLLLNVSSLKVQQRTGKLVLTFDVNDDNEPTFKEEGTA